MAVLKWPLSSLLLKTLVFALLISLFNSSLAEVDPKRKEDSSSATGAASILSYSVLSRNNVSSCIGTSPDIAFRCQEGLWTYRGNLTIGNGGDIEKLVIRGPSRIEGWLNIVHEEHLALEPPIDDREWIQNAVALLSISEGIVPTSASPQMRMTYNQRCHMTKVSSKSYSVMAMDTKSNTSVLTMDWNKMWFGVQAVTVANSSCYNITNNYRTFVSQQDTTRFVVKVRFNWRNDCATPHHPSFKSKLASPVFIVPIVMVGVFGIAAAVWMCVGRIKREDENEYKYRANVDCYHQPSYGPAHVSVGLHNNIPM